MWWNRASRCEFDEKSIETETTTWTEFPHGGKAIAEQILSTEERNKWKKAGLWESQSGIHVRKLITWVRSIEIEKLQQSSTGRSVSPVPCLWWKLKSPKTKTLADGSIERTSSMLDEIESKTVHNDEEGDW